MNFYSAAKYRFEMNLSFSPSPSQEIFGSFSSGSWGFEDAYSDLLVCGVENISRPWVENHFVTYSFIEGSYCMEISMLCKSFSWEI